MSKLEGRGLEKWYYYYYYYYYEVSNVYKRGWGNHSSGNGEGEVGAPLVGRRRGEEQGGEMMRSSVLKDGSRVVKLNGICKKEGRGI